MCVLSHVFVPREIKMQNNLDNYFVDFLGEDRPATENRILSTMMCVSMEQIQNMTQIAVSMFAFC